MTAIASMDGTTVKAIVDVTPTTMVIRPMAYVIVDSTVTRWCRRVRHGNVVGDGGSDGGQSDVFDAWREAATAGERCQEMARAGDGDGDSDGVCESTVMATAMVLAWMTETAAATLLVMATTQVSNGHSNGNGSAMATMKTTATMTTRGWDAG